MDFAFSEEQDMLRSATKSWLAQRYAPGRVAALADSATGWDEESWPQLRALGWLDPDLSMLEYAVLAEETGFALYPGPWWATVALAAPVLGTVPARPTTLAYADSGAADLRAAGVSAAATATETAQGWVVTGVKDRVPDGLAASDLLVVATASGGTGIWLADADKVGLRAVSTMDTTRRFAEVTLRDTPCELVLAPGSAVDALTAVRNRALALLACEAVGIAQWALNTASAYATERQQFGRPIGSFQGVSHRIADIYSELQIVRSLAYRAAWCVQTDHEAINEAVSTAAAAAGPGAVLACEYAMQSMGGIGFTWEHPLHRYYKRAQFIAGFDGNARSHRAELADALFS